MIADVFERLDAFFGQWRIVPKRLDQYPRRSTAPSRFYASDGELCESLGAGSTNARCDFFDEDGERKMATKRLEDGKPIAAFAIATVLNRFLEIIEMDEDSLCSEC